MGRKIGKMPINIKLHFCSGKTQLLEKINLTENLRKQLNNRQESGVLVDYEIF
jgi:hypothetical protein